jgi:hypothetical protein
VILTENVSEKSVYDLHPIAVTFVLAWVVVHGGGFGIKSVCRSVLASKLAASSWQQQSIST